MSLTIDASRVAPTPAVPASRAGATWLRVALAVALVAVSGALRYAQESRVRRTMIMGRESPFPLESIAKRIGPWEGKDEKLDSDIARATGSTDRVFRIYTDRRTGVRLNVIIIYGPASDVFIHIPENCYPASGYTPIETPEVRKIAAGDGLTVPFRMLQFTKGQGGVVEKQQVYYTWRHGDRWDPDGPNPKQVVRVPGMFKVHVARRLNDQELVEGRDPCQDFLELLVPEIERHVKAAEARGSKAGA